MREQAEAVQRMQDYIEAHLSEPVTLRQLASAAGYSPWHATRLFREMVGISPLEYLRARRLSRAALRLRDSDDRVLDIALQYAFDSHEGFTRAFSSRFGIAPGSYRKNAPPIPLFMPRSARDSFLIENAEGATKMNNANTVFIQATDRPARKMVVQRGKKASGYWEYCEEMGCDVEGVLASIKGALGEIVGLWMPQGFRPAGTSEYVMGVEVPADFTGPVPEGMELLELPAATYLHFQGEPYREEEMGQACAMLDNAFEGYRPERFGWAWADELGPTVQYAPVAERGCALARPVKKL